MKHIHTVYFWLKEGSDREAFVAATRDLLSQSGALDFWLGATAGTGREVADDTFDLGMTLVFASRADHDAYQVCQPHDDYVATWKDIWQRVQVYDVLAD